MDLHLKIVLVGDAQAGVDRRRHRSPVLVKLQAHHAGFKLLDQRRHAVRIAAPQKAEIHRPGFRRLQHFPGVEGTAGIDPDGDRTERAADHGGDPARQRMLDQARAVEMNVNVDRARRRDQPFAVAHRGAAGNDQARIDAVHDGGIAGLADADDAAVADAEIAFDDPDHRIDHDDVAQQEIQRALGAGDAGHADAVAQGLAAAMQAFVAVDGVVLFDDGRQRGVAEPDGVALWSGRKVPRNRGGRSSPCHHVPLKPRFFARSSAPSRTAGSALDPFVRLFRPVNSLRPPKVTSVTSFQAPGSNRTAVPAGISSRMPKAAARSNSMALLTSKKWKCEPIWIGRSPVLRAFNVDRAAARVEIDAAVDGGDAARDVRDRPPRQAPDGSARGPSPAWCRRETRIRPE